MAFKIPIIPKDDRCACLEKFSESLGLCSAADSQGQKALLSSLSNLCFGGGGVCFFFFWIDDKSDRKKICPTFFFT